MSFSSDRPPDVAFPRRGKRVAEIGEGEGMLVITSVSVLAIVVMSVWLVGLPDLALQLCAGAAFLALTGWAQHRTGWPLGVRDPMMALAEIWGLDPVYREGDHSIHGRLGGVDVCMYREQASSTPTFHAPMRVDIQIRLATRRDPPFDARRRFHPDLIVEGQDADLAAGWSDEDLEQLRHDLGVGLMVNERGVLVCRTLLDVTVSSLERQVVATGLWVAADLSRFHRAPMLAWRTAMDRDADTAGLDAYLASGTSLAAVQRRMAWRGSVLVDALAAWQNGDRLEALTLAAEEEFEPAWAAWLVDACPESELEDARAVVWLAHCSVEQIAGILAPYTGRVLPDAAWAVLARRAQRGDGLEPASWARAEGGLMQRVELLAWAPSARCAEVLSEVRDPTLRGRAWELSQSKDVPAAGRKALRELVAAWKQGQGGGGLSIASSGPVGGLTEASDLAGGLELPTGIESHEETAASLAARSQTATSMGRTPR